MALLPAPCIVVPLALRLVDDDVPFGRLARRLVPIGALFAVIGLALPVGPLAAAACLPWLVAAASVALAGAGRLATRESASPEELCIDVGFVYLPVGAAWLLASRAGWTVLGFSEPFVMLTAAHFHYAGFGALVLTGLTGRALGPRLPRFFVGVIALVSIAPVFTALGITFSFALERVAALALAAGLLAVSMAMVLRAAPQAPVPARPWLYVSGLTLPLTMALAAVYALRGLVTPSPTIPQMAAIHGSANVVGFVICGLIGFTRRGRA